MPKVSLLKVVSLALAGIGFLLAMEIQKRDIKDSVDEYMAKKEAELNSPFSE